MADVEKLSGYEIIDLGGATLLPGLIDNHVHMTVPFMYSVNVNTLRQMNRQIVYNFRNCVMRGVTTVRDVGGFPGKINKFRLLADANEIPGPRVISSLSPIAARKGDVMGAPEKAPYFKNPVLTWLLGGNYAERPETVEEIREASERMVSLGAQWLKSLYQEHSYSYNPRPLPNHSDEGYRAIVEVGKKHGLKCALHQTFVGGFKKGVDLGFHTLEHMPMDALIPEKYIEKFMKRDMAMMSTMMAFGDVSREEELLHLVETRGAEFLMPEAIAQMSARLKESIEQGKKKMSAEERKALMFDRQYLIDKYPVQVENLHAAAPNGRGAGRGDRPGRILQRLLREVRGRAGLVCRGGDFDLRLAPHGHVGEREDTGHAGKNRRGEKGRLRRPHRRRGRPPERHPRAGGGADGDEGRRVHVHEGIRERQERKRTAKARSAESGSGREG